MLMITLRSSSQYTRVHICLFVVKDEGRACLMDSLMDSFSRSREGLNRGFTVFKVFVDG